MSGTCELAFFNFGLLTAPTESPEFVEFITLAAEIFAAAEAAPGFIWRSKTPGSIGVPVRGYPSLGGFLSTWQSYESFKAFSYGPAHVTAFRRNRLWVRRSDVPTAALWWVPTGHHPTVPEAEERLRHLAAHGPSPYSFGPLAPFPPQLTCVSEVGTASS